jgi:DNA-binding NarL/FixJ family response regulator
LRIRGKPESYDARMAEIQDRHPRAYTEWKTEEDETLQQLFSSGKKAKEIAEILQRQPSAIRSRLEKLNLKVKRTTGM